MHDLGFRSASVNKDSRLVNCFVESSEGKRSVLRRPGLTKQTSSGTGTGQGIYNFNNGLVKTVGNSLYSYPSTLRGSIGTGPMFFTQTQTKPYLFMSNGTSAWTMDGQTNIISQITNDKVVELLLNAGGGGLNPGTGSLVFTGGSPSVAATGTYTVSSSGILTSVTLTSGGSGYSSAPTVTVPPSATAPASLFSGVISGSTLTVNKVYLGTITIGAPISGLGTVAGNLPRISAQTTGTTGKEGTYTLNNSVSTGVQGTVESFSPWIGAIFTASISGNTLTVSAVSQGSINTSIQSSPSYNPIGKYSRVTFVDGNNVPQFVNIISNGTGVGGTGTYLLDISFPSPVTSTTMYCGYGISGDRTVAASFIGCAGSDGATSITATLNAFPTDPLAVGAVYLDNTVYVMTTGGRIYNSGIEDPNTWGALDFVLKSSEPDGGVAICKHLNWLIAFGKWSMEVFYDNANPTGSPLSRNDSAKQEVGCVNGWSVVPFMDTVMFVGQTREAGRGVFMLNSMVPQRVSNKSLEHFLNADPLTNVRAFPFSIAGHYFYILQLKDSGYTFVYDMAEKLWYQWTSDVSGVDNIFKCMFGASINGTQYMQDETDGTIYTIATTSYQDQLADGSASPINFRIVTPLIDGGTNARKFFSSLELIGDRVTSTMKARHTDDDYQTFSSYRNMDMSVSRPIIRQCGAARRRAYEFFNSDNTPLRVDAVEFDIKPGSQ